MPILTNTISIDPVLDPESITNDANYATPEVLDLYGEHGALCLQAIVANPHTDVKAIKTVNLLLCADEWTHTQGDFFGMGFLALNDHILQELHVTIVKNTIFTEHDYVLDAHRFQFEVTKNIAKDMKNAGMLTKTRNWVKIYDDTATRHTMTECPPVYTKTRKIAIAQLLKSVRAEKVVIEGLMDRKLKEKILNTCTVHDFLSNITITAKQKTATTVSAISPGSDTSELTEFEISYARRPRTSHPSPSPMPSNLDPESILLRASASHHTNDPAFNGCYVVSLRSGMSQELLPKQNFESNTPLNHSFLQRNLSLPTALGLTNTKANTTLSPVPASDPSKDPESSKAFNLRSRHGKPTSHINAVMKSSGDGVRSASPPPLGAWTWRQSLFTRAAASKRVLYVYRPPEDFEIEGKEEELCVDMVRISAATCASREDEELEFQSSGVAASERMVRMGVNGSAILGWKVFESQVGEWVIGRPEEM